MAVKQDLSAVWKFLVQAGQIQNRFTGLDGKQIESGIRMGVEGPQHYARDIETGVEIRAGIQERSLDGSNFILQWNQFRALKPQVATLGLGRQRDYSPDVNDCFFACQDPSNSLSLLRRPSPVQMTFRNFQWAALPNALPVAEHGHFLWVPILTNGVSVAFPHWLQVLTLPLLQDFLILASSSTNLATIFNSMHAGASVNHIHFHSVHNDGRTALEQASVILKGTRHFLRDYAASGLVYPAGTASEVVWSDIEKLQQCGVPFNLIHAGARTYLIPRNIDHEVVQEFPSGVLAGMELLGKAITTEQSFYEQADWAAVRTALHKSTLRDEDVLLILQS